MPLITSTTHTTKKDDKYLAVNVLKFGGLAPLEILHCAKGFPSNSSEEDFSENDRLKLCK